MKCIDIILGENKIYKNVSGERGLERALRYWNSADYRELRECKGHRNVNSNNEGYKENLFEQWGI